MLSFSNFLVADSWAFTKCTSVKFLCLGLICPILFWCYKGYLTRVVLALQLPGPFAYPLIGNSYLVVNHKKLFHYGSHAKMLFGPVVRAWLTLIPVFFILEPNDVQQVLLSSKNIEKMPFYRWLENFVGKGLTTNHGDVWRVHRKILQPAFNLENVGKNTSSFQKGSRRLLETINCLIESGTGTQEVTSLINNVIFHILLETVLGVTDPQAYNSFTELYRRGCNNAQKRIFRPWLMFEWLYKLTALGREEMQKKNQLESFTKWFVVERRQQLMTDRNNNESNSHCLLDYMLKSSFTEEECVDEVITFMLAGQESVAGALAFTIFLLAKHESIQEKVWKEINDLTENESEFDAKKLVYLEQCIKESLRLYPSIAAFARRLSHDVKIGDMTIPAGADVAISPFVTQRLPQYFPHPDKFDPDRFNPESASFAPCSYMPFSAGPRNCIGMRYAMLQLQIILSALLREFKLTLPFDHQELHLKYRVTLRAAGGIHIIFQKRDCMIH